MNIFSQSLFGKSQIFDLTSQMVVRQIAMANSELLLWKEISLYICVIQYYSVVADTKPATEITTLQYNLEILKQVIIL